LIRSQFVSVCNQERVTLANWNRAPSSHAAACRACNRSMPFVKIEAWMWVPEPTLALPPLLPSVALQPPNSGLGHSAELQVTVISREQAVQAGQQPSAPGAPVISASAPGAPVISASSSPAKDSGNTVACPDAGPAVLLSKCCETYCPYCPDAAVLVQGFKRSAQPSGSPEADDAAVRHIKKRRDNGWKETEAMHIAEHMFPGGRPRQPIALPNHRWQAIYNRYNPRPDARERSYLEMITELSSRMVVWMRHGRLGPEPKIIPKVTVDW